MRCAEFRQRLDAYFGEELDEARAEEFEQHYFGCAACFRELQITEALQLKRVRIAAPAPRRFYLLRPALLLASLLLVAVSAVVVVQRQRQNRWLGDISRVDPPLFISSQMRTVPPPEATVEKRFLQAMALYNAGRYRPALDILEPLRRARPDEAKFNFFGGLCRLFAGDPDGARPLFDAIIATMDAAYFDEAQYYKGIALLRSGEVAAARQQFSRLGEMFSPLSGRAREMVGRIDGHSR